MPAGRVVWTVLAVTALTACPNGVTSQGSPTLESDGWTPVTSSQVIKVRPPSPQRYPVQDQQEIQRQELQRQEEQKFFQQQQQQVRAAPPAREPSPFLPDDSDRQQQAVYENQWDGFYGTSSQSSAADTEVTPSLSQDQLAINPAVPEVSETKNAFAVSQEENTVVSDEERQQQQQSSPSIDVEESEEVPEVSTKSTEKPPLIVYPAASIDPVLRDEEISVQTPSSSVPNFLQPKRVAPKPSQIPPVPQRFPPPGTPRIQPRPPLSKVAGGSQGQAPPPPRFRGGPRRPPPPRANNQQALPRSAQVPPVPGRPRARPRPPPPRRGSPPRPGLLDTIACKTKNLFANQKINDEAFMRTQIDCLLSRGPCDETGSELKRVAPEVIRGGCPAPCDRCKKLQIQKAIGVMQKKYPQSFQEVMKQFRGSG